MALEDGFRVKETTITTGTGTLTLAGAPATFNTFSVEIGNTNTCLYQLFDADGVNWEFGLGTIGAGTLTRDTVIRSSNADAALTLTAGTHTIVNAPFPGYATGNVDFGGTTVHNHRDLVNAVALSAGVATIPYGSGQVAVVTLDANMTNLVLTDFPAGGSMVVYLVQDATGGRTITLPAAMKASGGVVPTWSTGANEYDVITIISKDGVAFDYGSFGLAFS